MLSPGAIKKILESLPTDPGIYKMIDETGRVIYLGKAKSIRKRVSQYFHQYSHSTRTKKMVEQIAKIDTISVDTELEAIILETNLIKQLLPKYNILMKDDKNYVYIKITREDFPRIQLVRKVEKDKAKYFGPKTAAHKAKETLGVLKKIFPFRHCNLDIAIKCEGEVDVTNKVIKYPCLDFYIKRCIGPCIAKCTKEEYAKIVENVENFLEGKVGDIMKNLHNEMQIAAQDKKFEKAAKIRDKIKKVEDILEKQKVSDPNQEDKDIINYCIIREKAYFNLFQIRDGKLIGQENFILGASEIEEEHDSHEVLEAFMLQYYQIATDIPREILIPHHLEDPKIIEAVLNLSTQAHGASANETKNLAPPVLSRSELYQRNQKEIGKKAKIVIPQIGVKNKLLEMSLQNAKIFADRNKPKWQEESELSIAAAQELQKVLNLEKVPKRIECYDISHLSGTDTVGSMIVFENGVPNKTMYRKFTLKTLNGKIDDYKSMEEVLTRRFSKIAKDVHLQAFTCRKSAKKDTEFILETLKLEALEPTNTFYLLEEDKIIVGIISTEVINEKINIIKTIWLAKAHDQREKLNKILKYSLDKVKNKRIYTKFTSKNKENLLLCGFEEIKKNPPELEALSKNWLVYDKNKHKPDLSFSKIPDLLIIDGGKGQLASCHQVLTTLMLNIPHISLAKRLEEIFLPEQPLPILLEKNHEALKLLQRARDEAHRFALSFNLSLRSKRLLKKD